MGFTWFVVGIICTLAAGYAALIFIDRDKR